MVLIDEKLLYLENHYPRGQRYPPKQHVLLKMMRRGLLNADSKDHPLAGATRAMRYSACLADHLMGLLEDKWAR